MLAEAARYPHLLATIGFMRRFDPSYKDAFDKIQSGAIGRPFLVRSQTTDKNDEDGFFVRFSATSGGIFLDCTVHDIDVARWLLGKPRAKRVFAAGAVALHEGLREFGDVDNGVAICEFEDGKLAMFYASRTQAHGNDTHSEVIGTAGALAIGYDQRYEVLGSTGMLQAGNVRPTEVTAYSKTEVSSDVPEAFFLERYRAAYALEIAHFFDAVTHGKPVRTTVADGLKALELAEAATRSWREGRAVKLGEAL